MKIKIIENGIFEKNQLQDLETLSPQDLNAIIGGCFLNICIVQIPICIPEIIVTRPPDGDDSAPGGAGGGECCSYCMVF